MDCTSGKMARHAEILQWQESLPADGILTTALFGEEVPQLT